jgi:hypothetical protein
MRVSGKNGKEERNLEKAISELVVQYARAKDEEVAEMEYRTVIKGIAEATRELANAAVVAAEYGKMTHRKHYEARYYVSSRGVNGNLVRSWEATEQEEEATGADAPASPECLLLCLNFSHTSVRIACYYCNDWSDAKRRNRFNHKASIATGFAPLVHPAPKVLNLLL